MALTGERRHRATAILVAASLLAGGTGSALSQTLACNPKTARIDPGAGFTAFGASEQALARAGNAGQAWEWALGPDTDGSAKSQGSADWTSGRNLAWTLTHSGSGSARLVVRDGSTTLLTLDYPSGMEAGNALELRATMNSSVGSDTSIRASVSSLKERPAAGALSLVGSNQAASQALYFYYPPMRDGFTAQGNVMLTYPTLPTGSRVAFTIKAGTLPCTNQAPAVSLASPAGEAILQAGSAALLAVQAADADGAIAQVEYFADGASVGTAIAAPFSIQWTPTPGSHVLTAVATDNAGDATTSSQVAVVANAQPTASISAPAPGTILQPPGAFTLTAAAADSDGAVSKVDFYQGTTLLGTSAAAPYSFHIASLPPGSYSFSAVATDDRGGSASSSPVSIAVNAPPTVSLTSPSGNTSFKAPADISLSASAGDSDGSISSVAFYNGDTLISALTAAPYAINWTGVPQGTYAVTARVTDNTGYTVSSAPIAVTVIAGEAKLYFIGVDHLNTPRSITDANQRVVWRWDQEEPFGDNVPDANLGGTGTFELPLRLPGQYFDNETSLLYNSFRDYDSSIGRYAESDPIGLGGGTNTYSYSLNNPLIYVDPFGLDVTVCYYYEAAGGFGHVGYGVGAEQDTFGYYPTGNAFGSPGLIKKDEQKGGSECKVIPSKPEQDKCMLDCRARRQADAGTYSLTTNQCTGFVRQCLVECGLSNDKSSGSAPRPFYLKLPGRKR